VLPNMEGAEGGDRLLADETKASDADGAVAAWTTDAPDPDATTATMARIVASIFGGDAENMLVV